MPFLATMIPGPSRDGDGFSAVAAAAMLVGVAGGVVLLAAEFVDVPAPVGLRALALIAVSALVFAFDTFFVARSTGQSWLGAAWRAMWRGLRFLIDLIF